MKVKTVSKEELEENNPTLCLSPLRVFEQCHECDKFKQRKSIVSRKSAKNVTEEEVIDKMSCKPVIKPEMLELLKKKSELLNQVREVEEEINEL